MSGRITTITQARTVLADVNAAASRLQKTQTQLTSGKLLTRPSDDPSAVGRSLRLHRELEATQQFQRNVSEAASWQDVTESALSRITDAIQRARELVVQAGNDAGGDHARRAVAEEVRSLIDTVKGTANVTYSGRYIFAGSRTDTKPYQTGPAAPDTFAGDTLDIRRQVGPGVAVKVNVDGQAVIGDDSGGLLRTLRNVLTHLGDGGGVPDGQALRSDDLRALDADLARVSAWRATVGATTSRLEAASGRLADYEGTTMKLLSENEDVDFAKAMVDYSTQQAAMQAALKAGATIVQNSLLDFLA